VPFPSGQERRIARINFYNDGPQESKIACGFGLGP
jgi:hypothetical protein